MIFAIENHKLNLFSSLSKKVDLVRIYIIQRLQHKGMHRDLCYIIVMDLICKVQVATFFNFILILITIYKDDLTFDQNTINKNSLIQ